MHWEKEITAERILIQEQILCSQRVESFAVDAWINHAWQQIAEGTTIGYKKILRLHGIQTTALRLRILDSRIAPTIQFMGVYA